jgi:hypothetical protein
MNLMRVKCANFSGFWACETRPQSHVYFCVKSLKRVFGGMTPFSSRVVLLGVQLMCGNSYSPPVTLNDWN